MRVIGMLFLAALLNGPAMAQQREDDAPRKQLFVPVDQLDGVLQQDQQGVMLSRVEFETLLKESDAAKDVAAERPFRILVQAIQYNVAIGDEQATIAATINMRQFQDGWSQIRLPIRGLSVEKAEIDGAPAPVARDVQRPELLTLFHDGAGDFQLVLTMSMSVSSAGGDRILALPLINVASATLTVEAGAKQRLLIDEQELERPAPIDEPATYTWPVGSRGVASLRLTGRLENQQAQSLIFAQTSAGVALTEADLEWRSQTRISVFGQGINQLVFDVPSALEITDVVSDGLESWTLADDPAQPNTTQVTLNWRQPVTDDRTVTVSGVASLDNDGETRVPWLKLSGITSHVGRVAVSHRSNLRLQADPQSGIRTSETKSGEGVATAFDFWEQEYVLQVAVRPRDRELLTVVQSSLSIQESLSTLTTSINIETLNAPLFEVTVQKAAGWDPISAAIAGTPVTWREGAAPDQLLMELPQPLEPGSLLKLDVVLQQATPEIEPTAEFALPFATIDSATVVDGQYLVVATNDLDLSAADTRGLEASASENRSLSFVMRGSEFAGTLSIRRRTARLASRCVVRVHAEENELTTEIDVSVDITGGTVRRLSIQLPEAAGTDVRFTLLGITNVPGIQQSMRVPMEARLVEQRVSAAADGRRTFELEFDRRLLGSVNLRSTFEMPVVAGQPIVVPVVAVSNAVGQHGLIVVEAFPDQQLNVEAASTEDEGLIPADVSLLPGADGTGGSADRRIVAVYRFVKPDYRLELSTTQFDSVNVATAVCPLISHTTILGESGSVQQRSRIQLRAIGVQTLIFALPNDCLLWSAVLNGDPVEVRRDEGNYLVALPSGSNRQDHTLELLYEAEGDRIGAIERIRRDAVAIAVRSGDGVAQQPVVLRQDWELQYPRSALLVNSDGAFRPSGDLDQPGLLQQLSRSFRLPTAETAAELVIPVGIVLLVALVLVALIRRRRWKAMAGGLAVVVGIGLVLGCLGLLLMPAMQLARESSTPMAVNNAAKMDDQSESIEATDEEMPGDLFGVDMDFNVADSPAPEAEATGGFGNALPPGDGGFAGGGLGGMGEAMRGGEELPKFREAMQESGAAGESRAAPRTNRPAGMGDVMDSLLSQSEYFNGDMAADEFVGRAAQQEAGAAAGSKSGSARLSVRVELEEPRDYRSRSFTYIGMTDAAAARGLEVTLQNRTQILVIRWLIALLIAAICFWSRHEPALGRWTCLLIVMLIGIGLVPVAKSEWQSVIDGVVLGTVLGAGVWLCHSLIAACVTAAGSILRRIRRLPLIRRSQTAATIILLLVVGGSSTVAQQQQQAAISNDELDTIVVPYDPEGIPLAADRVFVPLAQFRKLLEEARPGSLEPPGVPTDGLVAAAYYRSGELESMDETNGVLPVEARFVVRTFRDNVRLTIPLGPVAVQSAEINGESALLELSAEAVPQQQAELNEQQQEVQQRQQAANAPAPGRPAPILPHWTVLIPASGEHVLDLNFEIAVRLEGPTGRFAVPFRPSSSGLFQFTLPADDLEVRANGRSDGFRRDGRLVEIPIADSQEVIVQWRPESDAAAGDVVLHAVSTAQFLVEDSGLHFLVDINAGVRQGELTQFDVELPMDYSIRRLTGADVAGWSLDDRDGSRVLKVLLRRTVSDQTAVVLELYKSVAVSAERIAVDVPILAIPEATRDSGVLTVVAGQQFFVRSDGFTGVSQTDLDTVARPAGADTSVRPRFAWRYTRHPADVKLRIAREASVATVEAIHAVSVEFSRLLWTSRLNATIAGAPLQRLAVAVPQEFLPLRVDGSHIADWYLSDSEREGVSRVLNVEFSQPVLGTALISIQGQTPREPDELIVAMTPPAVLGVDSARSQLGVWLDLEFEPNGAASSTDWTPLSITQLNAELQNLISTAPALGFRSTTKTPGAISVPLKRATPTMIAETVTLLNLTDTALDISLAVKWNIDRAASDTFRIEMPTWLADVVDFQAAGLRAVTRADVGNDRAIWTLTLQRPIDQEYFALGVAALPTVTDGDLPMPVIRLMSNDDPAEAAAAAPLARQSHFVVVVNQSSRLLSGGDAVEANRVSADHAFQVRLPAELLNQAMAIAQVPNEGPLPNWTVRITEDLAVAPAVISLAEHTTVIAEDSSWRSHHRLRIRNDSRQFLPLDLPEDSILLSAMVRGIPTRALRNGQEGTSLLLLPIPQTGEAGASYVVELIVSGTLPTTGRDVGTSLRPQQVKVPVLRIPEFRDDAALGVSILSNTWSVYVPESWDADLVDDPRVTNVSEATGQVFNDAIVTSVVSEMDSLIQTYKAAKGRQLNNAFGNLKALQLEVHNYSGSEATSAEQRRVLQEVERLEQDFASKQSGLQVYSGAVPQLAIPQNAAQDGGILFSPAPQGGDSVKVLQTDEAFRNTANYYNNLGIINQNNDSRGNITEQFKAKDVEQQQKFFFDLPKIELPVVEDKSLPKPSSSDGKDGGEGAERQGQDASEMESEKGVSGKSSLRSQALQGNAYDSSGIMSDNAPAPPARKGALMDGRVSGQAGQQGNGGRRDAGEFESGIMGQQAEQDLQFRQGSFGIMPQSGLEFEGQIAGVQLGGLGDPQDAALGRQTVAPSTGVLSLQFRIPELGTRHDFSRTGGNPELTLSIQGQDAIRRFGGFGWLAACIVASLVLLRRAQTSGSSGLVKAACLILLFGGLAGWFLLPNDMRVIAALCWLGALAVLSIWSIVESLRSPRANE